jgi:CDP-diacylglycerol pyrophosphatase
VQMLAIPTRRITGIEDPQMLAPDAPNVFADAWKAKALLEERLGRPLPRESVALTINSKWARSQEQLHVHVDCLAKSVAEKLEDYRSALDDRWRAMTVALNGRTYFAAVGATFGGKPGFILLADSFSLEGGGHAEDLQDHDCAITGSGP